MQVRRWKGKAEVRKLLGALLFLSGCYTVQATGPHTPCSQAAWETKGFTMKGRPAHVCQCRVDPQGNAEVRTCLDEPLRPPTAPPAPTFACITACGLRAQLSEKDCTELNKVEAQAIQAYAKRVVEFRPGYAACEALDGYTVRIHGPDYTTGNGCESDCWTDHGQCVRGLTWFKEATIEVFDERFQHNSLTHEIGHVLDKEFGTDQGKTNGHCGWERRGLDRAIQDVIGFKRVPDEDCD